MTVEADLYAELAPLVANRVYPNTFPLSPPNPAWPSIRYSFASEVPAIALCGNSDDASADTRVQLDLVAATYSAARGLRQSVMAAMETFDPPAVLQSSFGQYDAETKTHREILDYLIHASE